MLIERGFLPNWISWLLAILTSSFSAMRVNGVLTEYFQHHQGLRQGDPLSPLLFILVADALQSFLSSASAHFATHVFLSPMSLQYADDTIILMEAATKNILVVKHILSIYAGITGLKINDSKSVFVPISIEQSRVSRFQSLLGCPPKELPITYLGLPLSIRKCKKIHFLPLLVAAQKKLDGWKSKFLSLGGRTTLVKSVLTAMPLHYMQVLQLPVWLVQQLEAMRRKFLWRGNNKCLGGHCLVNWRKCCLPRRNGGLGILHLATQNKALLTKWIWKLVSEPGSPWATFIQTLYGTTDPNLLLSDQMISSGLRDILRLNPFFLASVTRVSANNQLTWRWTATGVYSASSAYAALINPGVQVHSHRLLWKIKAPPKVKLFLWLLLQDRLLTQRNLQQRAWPTDTICCCCISGSLEDSMHLFIKSDLATQVWTGIQIEYHLPTVTLHMDLHNMWLQNRVTIGSIWDVLWAATCWNLWKERNARIFSNKFRSTGLLLASICNDVRDWNLDS